MSHLCLCTIGPEDRKVTPIARPISKWGMTPLCRYGRGRATTGVSRSARLRAGALLQAPGSSRPPDPPQAPWVVSVATETRRRVTRHSW
jgi:hypothetical protein